MTLERLEWRLLSAIAKRAYSKPSLANLLKLDYADVQLGLRQLRDKGLALPSGLPENPMWNATPAGRRVFENGEGEGECKTA